MLTRGVHGGCVRCEAERPTWVPTALSACVRIPEYPQVLQAGRQAVHHLCPDATALPLICFEHPRQPCIMAHTKSKSTRCVQTAGRSLTMARSSCQRMVIYRAARSWMAWLSSTSPWKVHTLRQCRAALYALQSLVLREMLFGTTRLC